MFLDCRFLSAVLYRHYFYHFYLQNHSLEKRGVSGPAQRAWQDLTLISSLFFGVSINNPCVIFYCYCDRQLSFLPHPEALAGLLRLLSIHLLRVSVGRLELMRTSVLLKSRLGKYFPAHARMSVYGSYTHVKCCKHEHTIAVGYSGPSVCLNTRSIHIH